MNLTRIVSGSVAVLMLASLFLTVGAAEEDLGIEVGDFWTYSLDMEEDGMTMSGSLKMKVDGTSTFDGRDIFVVEVTGSGDVSGTLEGQSITGSLDIEGEEKRLMSDFDVVVEDITMEISMSALGMTITMTMGVETEYDPSMDDFIGDDDMTINAVETSEFSAVTETYTEMMGISDSENETVSGERTLTVVDTGVSVTVPAGTFECCKLKVETTMNETTDTEYWYYSDEVGFYVKRDVGGLGEGLLELEDYSHGEEDGLVSMLTGDNLWLTILLIFVVVVIIVVAVAMRSRRGKTPAPLTPPRPDREMPPPPGPGGPEVPPGEPMQPPLGPPPG